MRRWIMCCLLIAGMAIPLTAQAQRERTSVCRIDLTDVVTDLIRAQGLASAGDLGRALTLLSQAESALAAIEGRCELPLIIPDVELGANYASLDGAFAVEYPASWSVGRYVPSPNGGGVFLGSSPTAAAAMEDTNPSLAPGDQGMLVNLGNAVALTGGANIGNELGTVLAYYQTLLGIQYGSGVQFELIDLNGRAAGRTVFSGETFDGALVIVELGPDRFVVVAGAARGGEGAGILELTQAVAATVR